MAQTVCLEAHYSQSDPDMLFANALDFSEIQDAMRGLAVYEGVPNGDIKQGDRFTVDVTFWGIIKTKGHVIQVETLDQEGRLIQSREHNAQIRQWDHRLTILEHPQGGALWRDAIVIDAGWKTWIVARFAALMYRRRHLFRQADEIRVHLS